MLNSLISVIKLSIYAYIKKRDVIKSIALYGWKQNQLKFQQWIIVCVLIKKASIKKYMKKVLNWSWA